MFFVFLLLWFVFNGNITMEILLFGIPISALLYAFICKFMGYSYKKDLAALKQTKAVLLYIGLLFKEIIKANMDVLLWIYSSKYNMEPAIVHFTTDLKSELAQVVLANSITITPGTITASLEDGKMIVHCLDKDMGVNIDQSDFVKALKKMEEK